MQKTGCEVDKLHGAVLCARSLKFFTEIYGKFLENENMNKILTINCSKKDIYSPVSPK